MIRSSEGVIFKENGVAGVYHYKTIDYSWTKTTMTIDTTKVLALVASAAVWTPANLVLRQRRDDWSTYAETTPNTMGWLNNDYIYLFTYVSTTSLQVSTIIAVPCNVD